MPVFPRPRLNWQLPRGLLQLGERTMLLGILNCTPDSFSDGGRHTSVDDAVRHGLTMLDEGADILDLGAESTRPGASPVEALLEQERLLPVLRRLRQLRPHALLSVDTYHASTASLALAAEADIINDVSGLLWDPAMAPALVKASPTPAVVVMHARGTPLTWRSLPPLPPGQETGLVRTELARQLAVAVAAGIPTEAVVLDPGFGFGKRGDENIALLAHLPVLHALGRPLLVGLSRKGFLASAGEPIAPGSTPALSESRLQATTAAHTAAVLAGAHLVRVHDVAAARAAVSLADRLQQAA